MPQQFEPRMPDQMNDVRLAAGEEVVDAEDVVTFRYQSVAQMRTEEAGAAGDKNRPSIDHPQYFLCLDAALRG